MKDHGPEWKYVAIVEEKEKGNPKVQCRVNFKIRWPF